MLRLRRGAQSTGAAAAIGGTVSIVPDLSSNIIGGIGPGGSSLSGIQLTAYPAFGFLGTPSVYNAEQSYYAYGLPAFGGDADYHTDPTTGFVYVKMRWYDPFTGQWVSPDPIDFGGGDLSSLYRYVESNPIMHMDPSGLSCSPYNIQPSISISPTNTVSGNFFECSYELDADWYLNWQIPACDDGHGCVVFQYFKGTEYDPNAIDYPTVYKNWTKDDAKGWPYPPPKSAGFCDIHPRHNAPGTCDQYDGPRFGSTNVLVGYPRSGRDLTFVTCLCGTDGSINCYQWGIKLIVNNHTCKLISNSTSGPTKTAPPFTLPSPCGTKST